jgi:hypothetical protein
MASRDHPFESPDPRTGIDHPQLLHLLALWRSNQALDGIPPRSAFTPETLRPWLGHIGIIDVERSPLRFRIRLAGMAVVEFDGFDATGRYVDEAFLPPGRDLILNSYARCQKSRAPQFTTALSRGTGAMRLLVQWLLLPVDIRSGEADQIISCLYADPAGALARAWQPTFCSPAATTLDRSPATTH